MLVKKKDAPVKEINLAKISESRPEADVIEAVHQGADLDAVDGKGWTALHYAIKYGRQELALLLVRAGANINSRAADGVTPLHVAAAHNRLLMAHMLVRAGADVKAVDEKGRLPETAAQEKGNDYLCDKVLGKPVLLRPKSGVRPADANKLGQTLIRCLEEKGKNDKEDRAMSLVAQGAALDIPDSNIEFTALLYAVRDGYKELFTDMMAADVDVNAPSKKNGWTPLLIAAHNNRENMAEALLIAAADPQVADKRHDTPEAVARQKKYFGFADMIARAPGMLTPVPDIVGGIPPVQIGKPQRELALKFGRDVLSTRDEKDAVAYVRQGADVKLTDTQGKTVLHVAAEKGWDKLAKIAIAAGADVSKVSWSSKRMPLEIAGEHGHAAVARVLLKAEAPAGAAAKLARAGGHHHVAWLIDGTGPRVRPVPQPKPAQQYVPEKAPALPPQMTDTVEDGVWHRQGDDFVARTQTLPALNRKITMVFNFAAKERYVTTINLQTRAESMAVVSFGQTDRALLKEAQAAFIADGGDEATASIKSAPVMTLLPKPAPKPAT
ncbi:MAG: ankyrin repeat domain-containing protein [Alphaproteobacteria bacterium]|nr:ankyrin repeat domain-containing protein [Alphaproteobacteria bacterium]